MKIKTWIKYEESYIPPRCRKPRYRECEEFVDVPLKEVCKDEFTLAFDDQSYNGKGKIYFYKNKLWAKVRIKDLVVPDKADNFDNALDALKWINEHSSQYFPHYWRDGAHPERKNMISAARRDIRKYVLCDGELYTQTPEPRYVINVFGLGHNHGGTGMFCDYKYNPNISKTAYFSAIEGEQAVQYANAVALGRGDTNDVGKFKPFIKCYMPEIVKVKPNKQHGYGNKILNEMEDIIRGTDDPLTAGLLCMINAMN